MICYLGTAFCISPNCKNDCGRQLTDKIREAAKKLGLPICTGYFCGPMSALNTNDNHTAKAEDTK